MDSTIVTGSIVLYNLGNDRYALQSLHNGASTELKERLATRLEKLVDLEVSQAGELYYLARGSMGSPALMGRIGYSGN